MEKYYDKITTEIKNIYNSKDGKVMLHSPVFSGNEKKYLLECIDSTYVSSVGNFVDEFERRIAEYTGAAAAVVCTNGTAGLHLALVMAGVSNGNMVLTQALTFAATCNAISYTKASPVFIDVDKDTLGMSPLALRNWLENNASIVKGNCRHKKTGKRIGAVVVMHTFGHPAKIDRIKEICDEWSLPLIEDAAESIGSKYKGRHTGTFGLMGVLSFNGNKTITTGGGGMLLFNDIELARKAKHLSTQAKISHPWAFYHDSVGYNYRMPNINAALGCAQLEQIDNFIANKRETAEIYKSFFKDLEPHFKFFTEPKDAYSNYWLNAIILPNKIIRDGFLEYTNDHGVMTRPVWELMSNLPMWKRCPNDGLTNSKWLSERIVNIPSGVRPT